MHHAVDRVAFARVADENALAVLAQQHAGVANLTAALGIKDCAVELDATLGRSNDASDGGLQISVVSE